MVLWFCLKLYCIWLGNQRTRKKCKDPGWPSYHLNQHKEMYPPRREEGLLLPLLWFLEVCNVLCKSATDISKQNHLYGHGPASLPSVVLRAEVIYCTYKGPGLGPFLSSLDWLCPGSSSHPLHRSLALNTLKPESTFSLPFVRYSIFSRGSKYFSLYASSWFTQKC